MIIIGEKINSSLKAVRPAIENYDAAAVQNLARKQFEAGAVFIDVNAGMFVRMNRRLEWSIPQKVVNAPFSVFSQSPGH